MGPRISVVMVDGSFRERFHALRSLGDQTIPGDGYEVLWAEHYDAVRPEVAEALGALAHGRLLTLGRDGEYHSSYCFNAGIVAARGELVVIPDADVMVERDFLERLWALHADDDRLVTYCYRYNELLESRAEEPTLEHLRAVGVLTHPSNWGGCLAVRRRWLLEVGGYEQHPLFAGGDHGNDFDMYVRLKNLGLKVCWPREPVLYHPWHPGTLEFAYSHKLQAVVTQFRAHERSTCAFQGIDPSHDRELPEQLAAEVEEARQRYVREREEREQAPAGRF